MRAFANFRQTLAGYFAFLDAISEWSSVWFGLDDPVTTATTIFGIANQ